MGERLAQARKAVGLTQHQLAARVGMSPATIAMYETSMRTPPGPVLVALARCLGVSAESLIDAAPPAIDSATPEDQPPTRASGE